ncbi:GTPase-activator protein for Ras family GTPase [Pelomyxa schiedti]|nr:GTPase-activator protein for Ras family GTPase [Pelomyxa schiedti]
MIASVVTSNTHVLNFVALTNNNFTTTSMWAGYWCGNHLSGVLLDSETLSTTLNPLSKSALWVHFISNEGWPYYYQDTDGYPEGFDSAFVSLLSLESEPDSSTPIPIVRYRLYDQGMYHTNAAFAHLLAFEVRNESDKTVFRALGTQREYVFDTADWKESMPGGDGGYSAKGMPDYGLGWYFQTKNSSQTTGEVARLFIASSDVTPPITVWTDGFAEKNLAYPNFTHYIANNSYVNHENLPFPPRTVNSSKLKTITTCYSGEEQLLNLQIPRMVKSRDGMGVTGDANGDVRLFNFSCIRAASTTGQYENCFKPLHSEATAKISCVELDVPNERVFVGTDAGKMMEIDFSGEVIWTRSTEDKVTYQGLSKIPVVIFADGTNKLVYFYIRGDCIMKFVYGNNEAKETLTIGTSPTTDKDGYPANYVTKPPRITDTAYELHSLAHNTGYFFDSTYYSLLGNIHFATGIFPVVIKYQFASCEQYRSCSSCTEGDSILCGWSPYNNICFYKYYPQYANWTSANGVTVITNPTNCPIPNRVTPTSGIVNLPMNVDITTSGDITASPNVTVKCWWKFANSSFYTSAVARGTTISCLSPSLPSGTAYEKTKASLYTTFDGAVLYDKLVLTFAFDNCSFFSTCSECHGIPSCNWCSLSSYCNVSCPIAGEATEFQCPAILSVYPLSAPATVPTKIKISAGWAPPAAVSFFCDWGLLGITMASLDTSLNAFYCFTPFFNLTDDWRSAALVLKYNDSIVEDSVFSDIIAFNFTGCSVFHSCTTCTGSCQWVSNPIPQCITRVDATSPSCPTIVSLSPVSGLDYTAENLLDYVSAEISTGWHFVTSSTYSCNWGLSSGNSLNSTAAVLSDTVLACYIPTGLSSISNVSTVYISISVITGTEVRQYTETAKSWAVFSCRYPNGTDILSWSSCKQKPQEQCFWCMQNRKCASEVDCAPDWRAMDFPKINRVENMYHEDKKLITAPQDVYIYLSELVPEQQYLCSLIKSTEDGLEAPTATAINNSTFVTCSFPQLEHIDSTTHSFFYRGANLLLQEQVGGVWVTYDNGDTSNDGYQVSLLDCGAETVNSCASCFTRGIDICKWDLDMMSCTYTALPPLEPVGTRICPYLTQISPQSGLTLGGDVVTVSLNYAINATDYKVKLHSQEKIHNHTEDYWVTVNAEWASTEAISFVSPFINNTLFGVYDVYVFRDTKPYTNDARQFSFLEYKPSLSSDDKNLPLIIGASVAGGVVLLAAMLGISICLIVISRKRSIALFVFDPEDHADFNRFSYDGNNTALPKGYEAPNWEPLHRILLDPAMIQAVFEVTQATESDKVSSSLVYLHAASPQGALSLISSVIEEEVKKVQGENLLFRANSFASKMFRSYSKMVGVPYLWKTLGKFIGEIAFLADQADRAQKHHEKKSQKSGDVEMEDTDGSVSSTHTASMLGTDFEIDPNLMKGGMDEDAQSYLLAQRSRTLLVAIMASNKDMPQTVRYLVKCIRENVTKRFPDVENVAHIAIGGVVFLRFICPSITSPHVYALLKAPPTPRLQRQLVLLCKVLQNLANGVLFGGKEPFMKNMNEFIARSLPDMNDWMDEIANIPDTSAPAESTTVPPEVVANSLVWMRAHLASNEARIRSILDKNGATETLRALEGALQSSS